MKRLLICTERHTRVIDAFISLAGAILTRRLIRIAWTNHRWGTFAESAWQVVRVNE